MGEVVPPRLPTPTQLRAQVLQDILADDVTALAAFSSRALKRHRARSLALWKRLSELTAMDDLGAGARGSLASALSQLAGAHARLVQADRLIMGLEAGDTAPAAGSEEDAAPVAELVARADAPGWVALANAHKAGQTVRARPEDDQ